VALPNLTKAIVPALTGRYEPLGPQLIQVRGIAAGLEAGIALGITQGLAERLRSRGRIIRRFSDPGENSGKLRGSSGRGTLGHARQGDRHRPAQAQRAKGAD
jgi:hypothetical protein